MKEFTSVDHGYTILLSTEQSERDIFLEGAHPGDIWFHLMTRSSPHLLLLNDGAEVTVDEIIQCCRLVKLYSNRKSFRERVRVGFIESQYLQQVQRDKGTVEVFGIPNSILI